MVVVAPGKLFLSVVKTGRGAGGIEGTHETKRQQRLTRQQGRGAQRQEEEGVCLLGLSHKNVGTYRTCTS